MEGKAGVLCRYITLSWILLHLHTATSNPLSHRKDIRRHRVDRDLSPDCDFNKGQFPILDNGLCPKNSDFDVNTDCCLKCTVSCPRGQRKAAEGCLAKCVECGSGTYNDLDHNRKPLCKTCHNCDDLSREYGKQCTNEENAQCGGCIDGFYEDKTSSNTTLVPCLKCFEESEDPTCGQFYLERSVKRLTIVIAVSVVGALVVVVIAVVVAYCLVRRVKEAKRQRSMRSQSSTKDNLELRRSLVNGDKDANTSVDSPDQGVQTGPSLNADDRHERSHGVQTGDSLRFAGNGGDEKKAEKGVTFGPDPERKRTKGILKKPRDRDPGDGSDSPGESPPEETAPRDIGVGPSPESPVEERHAWGLETDPVYPSNDSPEEEYEARGMSPNMSSEPYQSMPEWLRPQNGDDEDIGTALAKDNEDSPSPEYQGTPYPSIGSSKNSDNFQSLPRDWGNDDKL